MKVEKRDVVFKEEGQEYGQVSRILVANHSLEATCIDGNKLICHIPHKSGQLSIRIGDIILLALRHDQDDFADADVILKYLPGEASLLKTYGELPENIQLNEVNLVDDANVHIVDGDRNLHIMRMVVKMMLTFTFFMGTFTACRDFTTRFGSYLV